MKTIRFNTVIGDDESGYRAVPLLVPGQRDVERLLRGEAPTGEQVGIATEAAQSRAHLYPVHKSVKDALDYEQRWRGENIDRIMRRIHEMAQ